MHVLRGSALVAATDASPLAVAFRFGAAEILLGCSAFLRVLEAVFCYLIGTFFSTPMFSQRTPPLETCRVFGASMSCYFTLLVFIAVVGACRGWARPFGDMSVLGFRRSGAACVDRCALVSSGVAAFVVRLFSLILSDWALVGATGRIRAYRSRIQAFSDSDRCATACSKHSLPLQGDLEPVGEYIYIFI